MQSSDDPNIATLEAFYARVMQRVCSAYREESELPADEAAELLQQKWKQKLALYTGKQLHSSAIASVVDTQESSSNSDSESSEEEDASSSSSEEQTIGQPSAQLPSTATTGTSIFARMLGAKRKLNQLDGADSEEEDAVEWQDTAEKEQTVLQERNAVVSTEIQDVDDESGSSSSTNTQETLELNQLLSADEEEKDGETQLENEEVPSSPRASTDSSSLLVSAEDLAPVSGLSGSELPLQLAAEYSKFGHRGSRRGYVGDLHAIILTWPSLLGPSETVLLGELVWCYTDPARSSSKEGGLVKVLSLGDTIHELRVELKNGTVTTVPLDQVRRLKEYLIRKGSVRLQRL